MYVQLAEDSFIPPNMIEAAVSQIYSYSKNHILFQKVSKPEAWARAATMSKHLCSLFYRIWPFFPITGDGFISVFSFVRNQQIGNFLAKLVAVIQVLFILLLPLQLLF